MAHRFTLRLPASSSGGLPPASSRQGNGGVLGGLTGRLPKRLPRTLTLWQLIWAPFWIASDYPAPTARHKEGRPPGEVGLAGQLVVSFLNRLSRRFWLQRLMTTMIRAVWLTLAIGCLWLVIELTGGPALTARPLLIVGAAVGLLGLTYSALQRPTRRQIARLLDRSFGLQERMVTAVGDLGRDVPAQGETASVVYLQMADAANAVAALRDERALALRLPTREIVLAAAFGLLLSALFFFRGVGGGISSLTNAHIPPFVPAAQREGAQQQSASAAKAPAGNAPTVQQVTQRAQRSNEAQRDLQTLGRALADHAVTRPAADAIQRNNYPASADQLRALATNADQLSPSAREGLAQDLDQAALQMSPGDQHLAQAAEDAASGLRQGKDAAKEGVSNLGDAVEQTGSRVASQQDLAKQMQDAKAAESRQGADADPSGSSDSQQANGQPQQSGEQSQSGPEGKPGERGNGQSGDQTGAGREGDAESGQSESGSEQADDPSRRGEARQAGSGERSGSQERGTGGNPGQQPGDQGQNGSEPNGGQPGAPNGANERGSAAGQSAAGDKAGQGTTAGSGGDERQGNQQSSGGSAQDRAQAEGAPAKERVTNGDGSGGSSNASTGKPAEPHQSIELPRSDAPGMRTSDNGGSSTTGEGPGVTTASGSTQQGEVAAGGPDSNRVPADYRTLVEQYFSDPGASP